MILKTRIVNLEKRKKTPLVTDDDAPLEQEGMAKELKNVKVSFVSLVDRGANNERFALIKRKVGRESEDGKEESVGLLKKFARFLGLDVQERKQNESEDDVRITELLKGVVSLRKSVSDLAEKAEGTNVGEVLSDVDKQLSELETGVARKNFVKDESPMTQQEKEQMKALEKRIAELEEKEVDPIVEEDETSILEKYDVKEVIEVDDAAALLSEVCKEKDAVLESPEEGTEAIEKKSLSYSEYVRYMPSGKKPMSQKTFKEYVAEMEKKGMQPAFDKEGRPMMTKEGYPKAAKKAVGKPKPGAKKETEEEMKKEREASVAKSVGTNNQADLVKSVSDAVTGALAPVLDQLVKGQEDLANRVELLEKDKTVMPEEEVVNPLADVQKRLEKLETSRKAPAGQTRTVKVGKRNDEAESSDPEDPSFWNGAFGG